MAGSAGCRAGSDRGLHGGSGSEEEVEGGRQEAGSRKGGRWTESGSEAQEAIGEAARPETQEEQALCKETKIETRQETNPPSQEGHQEALDSGFQLYYSSTLMAIIL